MEIDRNKFVNDLRRFFCNYIHGSEFPPTAQEEFRKLEDAAFERYRNDSSFHARVEMVVHHVIEIAAKCG